MQSMRRLGYKVHAVVTARKGERDDASLAALRSVAYRVDFVERAPRLKGLASLKPILISSNNPLAEVPLSEDYDVTLAESEHAIPIFDNPQLRTKVRILRVHNNERKYMWELARADERLGWKLFFAAEAFRYFLGGERIYRKLGLDALWFISRQEFEGFSRGWPSLNAVPTWLPPSVTLGRRTRTNGPASKRVLFVGNLAGPLNREGLRWYLSEVHPALMKDPSYELVIAGSAGGSKAAQLLAREARALGSCIVHLDLEELGPLYDSCGVFINPMRRGSGVKMKTVHAVERQVAIVTTSVGAEGSGLTDGEHIRVADEPYKFVEAVTDLLNNPAAGDSMARRAFQFLKAHYDSDRNIESLLNSLLGVPTTAERPVR
jgi:glycosyltransferase involved in cell wall biosynthesis